MSINFLHAEKSQPLVRHCFVILMFVGKEKQGGGKLDLGDKHYSTSSAIVA